MMESPYFVVMECMEQGTLKDFLAENKVDGEETRRGSSGLVYLHSEEQHFPSRPEPKLIERPRYLV